MTDGNQTIIFILLGLHVIHIVSSLAIFFKINRNPMSHSVEMLAEVTRRLSESNRDIALALKEIQGHIQTQQGIGQGRTSANYRNIGEIVIMRLLALLLIAGCTGTTVTVQDINFADEEGVVASNSVTVEQSFEDIRWDNVTLTEEHRDSYQEGVKEAQRQLAIASIPRLPRHYLPVGATDPKLKGVHPHLVELATAMRDIGSDFVVIEGCRTLKKQKEYLRRGVSKTLKSKHLDCEAYDAAPLHNGRINWKSLKSFAFLNGMERVVCDRISVNWDYACRFGIDWDGDLDTEDQTFNDLAHREIVKKDDGKV